MAAHQHDTTAVPLRCHFPQVITCFKTVFPHYRAKMKGLDWGVSTANTALSPGTPTPRRHRKAELAEMQGDQIVPWSKGGRTLPDNLQMLCPLCNQQKGGAQS